MTIDPQNFGGPYAGGVNIVERVKNILITPQAEFDRIAAEPADVNKIYMGYVLPLVVLGAVCAFIGMSVIGTGALGISYRVPMVAGLVGAVLQVVAGVASVFIVAFITNALAPSFGSQQDMGKAHQLAAYGATAGLLARVFSILPPLMILGLLGLYSIALFYIGLPRLMKTPEDKRIGYLVVIVLIFIVVAFVLSAIVGAVQLTLGGFGAIGAAANAPSFKPN